MTTFAVAGLQLELSSGDNVETICREVRALAQRFPWVDMVLVGELAAYGPGLARAEMADGRAETALKEAAQDAGVWLLPGSLYEKRGEHVLNVTPVINPAGETVARYAKMFPFLPYEVGVKAGDDFVVFDVPDVGRFGVSICYDMWFPETTRNLAHLGAEVILHPSLTNTIDRDVELAMARANAVMNQVYFIDVNVAGRLGYGRSVAYGPGGELLHECGIGREIMPLELDLSYLRRVRERGWNGLGQVLKSFRDGRASYPAYGGATARAGALSKLGPLAPAQRRLATADRAAPDDNTNQDHTHDGAFEDADT